MGDALAGALVLWYVLTAASVAFMTYDLATNTPAMGTHLAVIGGAPAVLATAIAITTRFAPVAL